MTLAALVFLPGMPEWLKYGTLTSFAAPPVLKVAATWNWDSAFMAANFGWKAGIAVLINASAIHLAFLAAVVVFAHHPVISLGLFLFFPGFTQAYTHYQNPLILKEGLLGGFFLAGAVAGGGLTVIANAPNPAGVALLKRGFNDESIGAGGLLLGALAPTAVAAMVFLLL
jgi:hypothetical protein